MKLDTGVYIIRCDANSKIYVGSASMSFARRKRSHWNALRRGNHRNLHLQRAWDKYGEGAFEFCVLERCKPDQCIKKEQYWITRLDTVRTGFNSSPTAGNIRGMKLSESAKKKIAEAVTKQWLVSSHRELVSAKIAKTLTGRKLSPEALAKRTAKQRPILIARNKSKKMIARVRKAALKQWQNPEFRKLVSEKNRLAAIKQWKSAAARKRMSKIKSAQYASRPELRRKLSLASKRVYNRRRSVGLLTKKTEAIKC